MQCKQKKTNQKKKKEDLKLFKKARGKIKEREQGNFEGSRYIKKMHRYTVPLFSLDIIREEEEKKGV